MSLYTSLCSGLLFPLHERLKHHDSVAVRKRLEAQERLPSDALDQWRIQRLREFLVNVGERVPHYRDLFQSVGFHPERLREIPIMGNTHPNIDQELPQTLNPPLIKRITG